MTHPTLCGMCGIQCGIQCGTKSLISKACAVCAISAFTGARARACVCPSRFIKPQPTTSRAQYRTYRTHRTPLNKSSTYKKMDTAQHTTHTAQAVGSMEVEQKRVIRCTPDNVQDFRALVNRWPELKALVQGLQAQGHFPGLRAMQITLTGDAQWVGKGLAAVKAENAASAATAVTPCKEGTAC